MRYVSSYIRFIDSLNNWVGRLFSVLVYPMMFLLVYEVVMRYVFNRPTFWVHETTEFLYAAHFIMGGAYALRWSAHVNIELLYNRFPLRTRAIVDLLTWIAFYAFLITLLWHGGRMALTSVRVLEYSGSPWGPPVWPVKLTVPAAAALMLLQGSTKTIKDAYTAITGREFSAEGNAKHGDYTKVR